MATRRYAAYGREYFRALNWAGITEEMYEKFLKQLAQARAMAEVGEEFL